MTGPVYIVVLRDGTSLHTNDGKKLSALLAEHGDEVADVICADDFGDDDDPKSPGQAVLWDVGS